MPFKLRAPGLLLASMLLSLTACGGSDNNNPPVFSSTEYRFTGNEDTVITGQVQATDSDGDSINYNLASAASNGIFQLNSDGSFRYTPNQDYFGNDEVKVSASDGKASATVTIYFTILNVNDAPVVVSSTVTVNSEGITLGQINATDADNDPLTFSVVTPPETGDLILDSATGSFEYTPDTLEFTDRSFVVGVSDGIVSEPVTATIYLQPSFVTNQDKLNYYYSSALSHLKQAEQIRDQLADDSATDALNTALISGYLISGFTETADLLLSSKLAQLNTQANAYLDAAQTIRAREEESLPYLLSAQRLYSQFIAEKGLANAATTDTEFLMKLLREFIRAGHRDAATDLLAFLETIANSIRQPIQESNYGRLMTAASENAKETITDFLAEPDNNNYQIAFDAIGLFAGLAEQTGYATRSGENFYQTKALYLSWAADYYQAIGATAQAKEFTAKTLAIYTNVNYDSQYTYSAAPYAANSLRLYYIPLQAIAGLFTALYPELSVNPALELLKTQVATTSTQYTTALQEVARYQLLNRLHAGENAAAVFADIKPVFTNQTRGYSAYYDLLVFDTGNIASVATQLRRANKPTEVKAVLDEAMAVLVSNERYSERPLPLYLTGNQGCYLMLKHYVLSAENPEQVLQQCQQLVDNRFPSSSQAILTTQLTIAQIDMLDSLNLVTEELAKPYIDGAISALKQLIPKFTEQSDQFSNYVDTAVVLINGKRQTQANDFLQSALTTGQLLLQNETLTATNIQTLSNKLASAVGNRYDATDLARSNQNYIRALRRTSAGEAHYQTTLQTTLQDLQQLVSNINQRSLDFSVNEQQKLHPFLIKLNLSAEAVNTAETLANSSVVAAAERINYLTEIGLHLSYLDHFPGTTVANVDTDADGKPNFFLPDATTAAIIASGLVADDDSDGDGVPDSQDRFPLDPNRS